MSHRTNITRIKAVHNSLGGLKDKVVFVGGATVSLYAEGAAPEIRPTEDVDVLVEIGSRWEFAKLEEKLRQMGFQNDRDAKFIGRYLLPGLVVDIMPTDEKILGFSNKWYREGFQTAMEYEIDAQHKVKIFSPPYFMASKLEAFRNRGKGDGRTSSDFEDIVFVMENRPSLWDEMKNAEGDLGVYLIQQFKELNNNPNLDEWIDAHASFYSPPSSYFILPKLQEFIGG